MIYDETSSITTFITLYSGGDGGFGIAWLWYSLVLAKFTWLEGSRNEATVAMSSPLRIQSRLQYNYHQQLWQRRFLLLLLMILERFSSIEDYRPSLVIRFIILFQTAFPTANFSFFKDTKKEDSIIAFFVFSWGSIASRLSLGMS